MRFRNFLSILLLFVLASSPALEAKTKKGDVSFKSVETPSVTNPDGDLTLDSDNEIIMSKPVNFTEGASGLPTSGIATTDVAVSGTTISLTLSTDAHYLIDMSGATGKVTGAILQAGGADRAMKVTLTNNPMGYLFNIDGNGADIFYNENTHTSVSLGGNTQWAIFTWSVDDNKWVVTDNATFYSGNFNGDLSVTGTLSDASTSTSYSPDPIGTVKQSILTEVQFIAQIGPGWVPMEGQSVAGTKICTEYSICTLPDARSRFLRNANGSDGNLRGLVSDTTAKNGLSLTGAISGGSASLSGGLSVGGGSLSDPGHSHSTWWNLSYNVIGGDGYREGPYTNGSYAIATSNVGTGITHSHTATTIGSLGVSHTAATNGSLAIGAGNSETAPDHIIVNTFIKVD